MLSFFGPDVLDEVIAPLGQIERLGAYHFESGSAIAEVTLAPFRVV
jgi:hypothetical protein